MNQAFYDTLAVDIGRVLTTGPKAEEALNALERWEPSQGTTGGDEGNPSEIPTGVDAIPTLNHDALLASARGRWRMPIALQRQDFEAVFRMKAGVAVSVEDVLATIHAGTFQTAASLARFYGKRHSWVNSLMWFCLREKLVSDTATWHAYFPKRPPTKKPRQRKHKPTYSGPVEPFTLPPLDEESD